MHVQQMRQINNYQIKRNIHTHSLIFLLFIHRGCNMMPLKMIYFVRDVRGNVQLIYLFLVTHANHRRQHPK